MILPDYAADFLARHSAELPAVAAIATACALVAAVVVLSGRRRRAGPVIGHYTCHACRTPDAVALVRLPHERLARLACLAPECRAAYGVVPDDGDAVGTLHRAHAAYLRVMTRPVPPRNGGRRKASAVPAVADDASQTPAPSLAAPAESPDWSRFPAPHAAPEGTPAPAHPIPMPPPARTRLVESDAPRGNGT